MKTLYLLRHAESEPLAASDSARRLTEFGLAQAQIVAQFCDRRDIRPDIILSSPFTRAEQTAHAVSERLGVELITVTFLASGMTAMDALDELKAYREFESVMIVGHQPDFGELIAVLTGLPSASSLPVRKASLTALNLHLLQPEGATIDFSLPVRLM